MPQANNVYNRVGTEWEQCGNSVGTYFVYVNMNPIEHELGIYMISGNGWDINLSVIICLTSFGEMSGLVTGRIRASEASTIHLFIMGS